jgi:hypothetical protein
MMDFKPDSIATMQILRVPSCPLWFKVLVLVLAFVVGGSAQARSKRLILKDGTYQSVTKWEVKGDRVRYYSAERFMWEELPKELVDWKETERYNTESVQGETDADRVQAAADKALEEAASPKVAEGIRLPDYGGVYLLDQFKAKPQLVELVQSGSEINKQTGKNILRSVINPLPTGPRQTIELKGKAARVQSHVAQPEIYINIDYDDSNDSQVAGTEKFRLVRVTAKPKENRRVVSNLKIALTGRMKEQRQVIPAKVSHFTSEWLKIVPDAPLPPGEYALIEMLTPTQMNLYVWDFGMDPNAPENPAAWKPVAPKPLPAGTDATPVLSGRKKKN